MCVGVGQREGTSTLCRGTWTNHTFHNCTLFSGGYFVYLKGECHKKSFHTETYLLDYNLVENSRKCGVNIIIENEWNFLFDTDPQNGVRSSVAEPVHFWPAPALMKKYVLKKLKKMNNSTFSKRKKNIFEDYLFICPCWNAGTEYSSEFFLWAGSGPVVQNSVTLPTVLRVPVFTELQVCLQCIFWGQFIIYNFSSMVEPKSMFSGRQRNTG